MSMQAAPKPEVRTVGRYAIHGIIAAGGMATVHFGRLLGPIGFSRTVAIKRLHSHFATDADFVSMFLDEARLAARVRHPNVISTLDVVATEGELFLVMDYVPGDTLSKLARAARENGYLVPLEQVSAIVSGALHGLHSAHEAKDERGEPLGIVHRDVSPQNVHVGTDGVSRVLDFGVAKATGRIQTTREGQIKGKLAYMPPEQLRGAEVNRSCDIYAAGVMLWELITGERLFRGDNEGAIVTSILEGKITPPSRWRMPQGDLGDTTIPVGGLQVPPYLAALDACVMRALSRNPQDRFATARDMARALEACIAPASNSQLGEWVEHCMPTTLAQRANQVAEIEQSEVSGIGHSMADALSSARSMAEVASRSGEHIHLQSSADAGPQQILVPSTTSSGLSQASNLSVTSAPLAPPQQPPPSKDRLYIALGLVAALMSVCVLVGVLVIARARRESVEPSPPAVIPPSVVTTAAVPATAAPSSIATAPAIAATTVELDDPVATNPVPHGGASGSNHGKPFGTGKPIVKPPTSASVAAPYVPPSVTPPQPPTGPNCNPPYTLVNGIKKYKPECP
jgi:eukaryotic-like serine/threonine-protein kinase